MNMAFRRVVRAVLPLLLAFVAGSASAQLRILPPDAKRGELSHVQGMVVQINGTQTLLSPGAQIRDAANQIVLPMAVPPGSLVKYALDPSGQVFRVWILSVQEAAQSDRR